MRKITAQEIRESCWISGLTYTQIFKTLNLNPQWFNRMIMTNEKYAFKEPNQERMLLIWEYCKAYKVIALRHKKEMTALQEKWRV